MPDNQDIPNETINPDIHPRVLRFSIWDRIDYIEVPTDQVIVVGRSEDGLEDDVTVDLKNYHARLLGVSRRHLSIFPTATGLAIRDLNSANGTSLNGETLSSEVDYELNHGDELRVGGLYVTVHFA